MKILITGANGMLGHDLKKVLCTDNYLVLGTRDVFDITDIDNTIKFIAENRPDAVIHAAAYTDVDGCESNIEQAYKVNGLGARNVAVACQNVNAAMVYISTDYVFDGNKGSSYTEYDKANPMNIYGKSKLAGENYVKEICTRHYIVRTSWLFGLNGKNFVTTMLNLAKTKNEISVVDDQFGSPTYTFDLAQAIAKLIQRPTYGTFHITNSEFCTWNQFAKEIFEYWQQISYCDNNSEEKHTLVKPITTEELNRPASRPKYSVLENYNWQLEGYEKLRSYKDALKDYLHLLRQRMIGGI
mgnify:CR=1 FL=1